MDWEFKTSRYKLLFIEWISNKVLMYSTGNSIQYPVVNHNGNKEKKKKEKKTLLILASKHGEILIVNKTCI